MNTEAIANDLFNKVRGRFPAVTLGDKEGNVTNEPTQARYFDFDFKEAGKSLGKVSISIDEKDGLVILHNTDFIENSDEVVKHKWFEFLKELRNFAKARMLNLDTRDITNTDFWANYKQFGGNTVRNTAHLRILIEETQTKRKDQK